MNIPMTSKAALAMVAKTLTLLCVLLLAACDGGIFGTGGPDDALNMENAGAIPNGEMTGNINLEQPDTDSGTTGGDDGSTSGGSATTTGGSTTTEGTSATGGDTTADNMQTESGTTGAETEPAQPVTGAAPNETDGRFVNNTATLPQTDALVSLLNITNLTLNAFETSVEPDTVLFDSTGVTSGNQSAPAILTNNDTSLVIVENTNVARELVSYPMFNAAGSTFTTIIAFQNADQVQAVALDTQTSTTDSTLAKVRTVQVSELGDPLLEVSLQLQSSGSNPGGQDSSFGPISYSKSVSDYLELAAGDYDLVDPENRFPTTPLSFSGGVVYTIVISGTNVEQIFAVNDTLASGQ